VIAVLVSNLKVSFWVVMSTFVRPCYGTLFRARWILSTFSTKHFIFQLIHTNCKILRLLK